MTTRRARAILIGIEYPHLGSDKQLHAGRNDVLAFWKVCRRLGFSHENIHVFTSPVLEMQDLIWAEQEIGDQIPEYATKSADDIRRNVESWFQSGSDKPKVLLAEATRSNILGEDGLKWFADGNHPTVDRLLTYSGHGTKVEWNDKQQLGLCPNDLVLGQSETFIPIDEFKKELQGKDENLTVVLDCCFAQSSAAPRGAYRMAHLVNLATDKPLSIDVSGLGARVFCASGPNESSYQALLGGYWYSAFTWAMTVALEQWRICGTHSTISHGELLFRTRMLLEALSFPQHPVLLDKLDNTPVFGHVDSEDSGPEPNKERRGGQIDPSELGFAEYQFLDQFDNLLATVVATNKDDGYQRTGMKARVEYWNITNGMSLNSNDFESIRLKQVKAQEWWVGAPSFNATAANFTCIVDAPWVVNTEKLTYQSNNGIGFYIAVTKDDVGFWKGEVFFVQSANSSALLFGDVGVNGREYGKVTDANSRSLCNRSITPVTSGSSYHLFCETKGVYICDTMKSGSSFYVYTDPVKKHAHTMTLVTDRDNKALKNNDTVFIRYVDESSNNHMTATNSSYVWYNNGTGVDEQWTIEKVSPGDVYIRPGDSIRIKNVGGKKYLQAKGTQDYVDLGGSQIWRVE